MRRFPRSAEDRQHEVISLQRWETDGGQLQTQSEHRHLALSARLAAYRTRSG